MNKVTKLSALIDAVYIVHLYVSSQGSKGCFFCQKVIGFFKRVKKASKSKSQESNDTFPLPTALRLRTIGPTNFF